MPCSSRQRHKRPLQASRVDAQLLGHERCFVRLQQGCSRRNTCSEGATRWPAGMLHGTCLPYSCHWVLETFALPRENLLLPRLRLLELSFQRQLPCSQHLRELRKEGGDVFRLRARLC